MLKTRIKASQITNLTDARYFAAWGVEWLAFNFDLGSETYIEPVKMKEIRDWVEGPKIVGAFGLQDVSTIKEAIEMLKLDMVQVGNFTDVATVKSLVETPVIKHVVYEKDSKNDEILTHFRTFAPYVEAFLLTTTLESTSSFIQQLCKEFKIILDVNLTQDNLDEILETYTPYALNVQGGEEERVGVKSFDELDDIFEHLEIFE